MKQTNIDHYFHSATHKRAVQSHKPAEPEPTHRAVFIYDCMQRIAFFTDRYEPTDQFIAEKCKRTPAPIRLYLRGTYPEQAHPLPILEPCDYSSPLLKSNLQKAIRRKHTDVALSTALALIQQDITQFIRRLPIICIEDVCYLPDIAIVVWWMIAEDAYPFTTHDAWIMLDIIYQLCNCDTVFPYDSSTWDTQTLSKPPQLRIGDTDEVYVLYYRWLYGGMKGDRCLLHSAIQYYREVAVTELVAIHPMEQEMIDGTGTWTVELLEEAVDFHPYPRMLTLLEQWTSIPKDRLREVIWFVESAINVRKPATFQHRAIYQRTSEWKQIEQLIEHVRHMLI